MNKFNLIKMLDELKANIIQNYKKNNEWETQGFLIGEMYLKFKFYETIFAEYPDIDRNIVEKSIHPPDDTDIIKYFVVGWFLYILLNTSNSRSALPILADVESE